MPQHLLDLQNEIKERWALGQDIECLAEVYLILARVHSCSQNITLTPKDHP